MRNSIQGSLDSAWAPEPWQVLLTCRGRIYRPSPWFLQASSLKALPPSLWGGGACVHFCWFLWDGVWGKLCRVQSSVLTNGRVWRYKVVPEMKVTRKKPNPGNSGMFRPQLVNPNNLTVMKGKVCGEKQMLWLLQCYYIHKIYFIRGEFTQGVMRFLLYTLFITT